MNDNGAPARDAAANSAAEDDSRSGGRPAPKLVIEIPLEHAGRAAIVADSLEDELRLLCWLRRSSVLGKLEKSVERFLDARDEREAA